MFSSTQGAASDRNDLFQTKMFRETQWPAAEWRKTYAQNHSVVRVLRRIDDVLFYTGGGFRSERSLSDQNVPRNAMARRGMAQNLCPESFRSPRSPANRRCSLLHSGRLRSP